MHSGLGSYPRGLCCGFCEVGSGLRAARLRAAGCFVQAEACSVLFCSVGPATWAGGQSVEVVWSPQWNTRAADIHIHLRLILALSLLPPSPSSAGDITMAPFRQCSSLLLPPLPSPELANRSPMARPSPSGRAPPARPLSPAPAVQRAPPRAAPDRGIRRARCPLRPVAPGPHF